MLDLNVLDLGENSWLLAKVFAIVFGSLVLDFIQRRFVNKLHQRLERTANVWDDAVIAAIKRPLSLLIWVVGIAFAAQLLSTASEIDIQRYISAMRNVAVIIALAWFLVKLIRQAEENIVESHQQRGQKLDLTTVDAIAKLLRLSVMITAGLVVLQTLGFSISGVLAFGGVGGIAVGFAARDLLANFFGGLMIYLDRPFSVGDWVCSPDRQIEGTVEKIGWRLTVIRKFDKRPLYVPNAAFASITVENPSRMSHRRIYETIGVRYQDADQLEKIVAAVESMLKEHADIDQSQTLMVNFNSFAESSLDFFIYTFTRTTVWTEYHKVKQDVLFKIYRIIRDFDADVAFPTSTIKVDEPLEVKNAPPPIAVSRAPRKVESSTVS